MFLPHGELSHQIFPLSPLPFAAPCPRLFTHWHHLTPCSLSQPPVSMCAAHFSSLLSASVIKPIPISVRYLYSSSNPCLLSRFHCVAHSLPSSVLQSSKGKFPSPSGNTSSFPFLLSRLHAPLSPLPPPYFHHLNLIPMSLFIVLSLPILSFPYPYGSHLSPHPVSHQLCTPSHSGMPAVSGLGRISAKVSRLVTSARSIGGVWTCSGLLPSAPV